MQDCSPAPSGGTFPPFKGPKDTARDKAQWKGPRLLACEHSFGTERTDAGGNTDIGVLLATLPKPEWRDRVRAP
jgi:hypothetical protein